MTEEKRKVLKEIVIITVLVLAIIGIASFAGYLIYSQTKNVKASSPNTIQGYAALNFLASEIKLPINSTWSEG